jgi:hypothetical protein
VSQRPVPVTVPAASWARVQDLAKAAGRPLAAVVAELIVLGLEQAEARSRPAPATSRPVKRPNRLIDVTARPLR